MPTAQPNTGSDLKSAPNREARSRPFIGVWYLIARVLPAPLKRAIQANRLLSRCVMSTYDTLTSGAVVSIESGCLSGMRLVSGKHVSHAHVAGDYEREVQDVLHRHISEHDICYDVGASIGYMSLLMAKFGAFVYAFRPAPHAAEQIRLQLSANDLDNYEITPAPVSSDVRRVRFCVTDVAYGSAINETETRWPVLELETTTLDLFAQANRPPDFIKIDAEGEEARVLRGAENLLTTKRPIICCELHDEAVARQVLEILSGHDYAVDSIDGNSIDPGERAESGPFHIVAMPR